MTLQAVVNESCQDWGYTVYTVYCRWGMQVHDVKQKCRGQSPTSIWANLLSRYWIIKASWDEPWLLTEPAVRWRARRRTGSNFPDISILSTTLLRKLTRLPQQRHYVWGNESVSGILAEYNTLKQFTLKNKPKGSKGQPMWLQSQFTTTLKCCKWPLIVFKWLDILVSLFSCKLFQSC